MAVLPTKTKTTSADKQSSLRVSSRFARPTKRMIVPQREASKRLKELHKSEKASRLQANTGIKSSCDQTTTIPVSKTKPPLPGNADTTHLPEITIRLPSTHAEDAKQFIPIDDILDNLIARNRQRIPTESQIATAATYYFVEVCDEYPASLIRCAARVLIRHYESILERTTPRYKAYEILKAKSQFVKALRTPRAEMAKAFVETGQNITWLYHGL